MGQRSSSPITSQGALTTLPSAPVVNTLEQPHIPIKDTVPSFTEPWGLVCTCSIEEWPKVASMCGFVEHSYSCAGDECDRDSVCLKQARASLRKHSHAIVFHRSNQRVCQVSYARHTKLKTKIAEGFKLSNMLAAMTDNLALVIFYRWERLQYEAIFVLCDLLAGRLLGHFDSPMPNMSVMECKISPDLSHIAVLFYLRNAMGVFMYDVYLFSTQTFTCAKVIHCNREVRPYIAFDPRYGSSRLAIVYYYMSSDKPWCLVLYCTNTRKIVAMCPLMGNYYSVSYSRDGSYLILQKISEDVDRVLPHSDAYIFNSDNLQLKKHLFTNLPSTNMFCDTNYAPLFSHCGSRMCMMNELCDKEQRKLFVAVYQLPRPLDLQQQCRVVILQNLKDVSAVRKLPLPAKLKEFITYVPHN